MPSATDTPDITIDWIKPGGPSQVWVPMLHSPGSGLTWPLIAAGTVLVIAAIYLATLGASARLRWRLGGAGLAVAAACAAFTALHHGPSSTPATDADGTTYVMADKATAQGAARLATRGDQSADVSAMAWSSAKAKGYTLSCYALCTPANVAKANEPVFDALKTHYGLTHLTTPVSNWKGRSGVFFTDAASRTLTCAPEFSKRLRNDAGETYAATISKVTCSDASGKITSVAPSKP